MATKRRRVRRRRGGRKRARTPVYGVVRRRRPRGATRPVAWFRRYFWKEVWAWSTASTPGFFRYYSPIFNDIPNVAEYAALYDMYKVCGIKLTLRPKYNDTSSVVPVPAGGIQVPYVSYYVDGNTNYNPSGLYGSANYNTFTENCNGRVKTRQFVKPINIYFRPRLSQREVDGGSGNTNAMTGPLWLNTQNAPAITQRGVYIFIHDVNFSGLSANWSFDVFYTFYFKCKGPR